MKTLEKISQVKEMTIQLVACRIIHILRYLQNDCNRFKQTTIIGC